LSRPRQLEDEIVRKEEKNKRREHSKKNDDIFTAELIMKMNEECNKFDDMRMIMRKLYK
jgi:hypothetical protein